MPEPPNVRLVVIQPTSRCNLNCRYCYVNDRDDAAVMDNRTLVATLTTVLSSPLVSGKVEILWHAGEPLTAGIEFYKRAFALLEELRPTGLQVEQSIQTNATLVTRRWAELLSAHGVHVGVSIDGPADLHDAHRATWAGRGSHGATVRGIRQLQAAGVPIGALCVLTRDSLDHPDEIFDEFVRLGIRSVGLNVEEVEGTNLRSSLSCAHDAEFREFVERLWHRWRLDPELLEIREFNRTLRVLADARTDPTWHRSPDDTVGFRNITITKTGDVSTFSPELAGEHRFRLGNVHTDTLEQLARCAAYRSQCAELVAGMDACRRTCAYYRLCGGGYVSNKFYEHGTIAATETVTCRLHRQRLIDVVLDVLTANDCDGRYDAKATRRPSWPTVESSPSGDDLGRK